MATFLKLKNIDSLKDSIIEDTAITLPMYEYIPGNIKGCLSEVKILQKN
jgi:hypothetical protein